MDEFRHLLTGHKLSRVRLDIPALGDSVARFVQADDITLLDYRDSPPPETASYDDDFSVLDRLGYRHMARGGVYQTGRILAVAYASGKEVGFLPSPDIGRLPPVCRENALAFGSTVSNEAIQSWMLGLRLRLLVAKDRKEAPASYQEALEGLEAALKLVCDKKDVRLDVDTTQPNVQPHLLLDGKSLNLSQLPAGVRHTFGWVADQQQWTVRWLSIHNKERKGDWATRKAKEILKAPLGKMSHGKCAYCEYRFGRGSGLEVEHYISRHEDPNRAFEWTNLLPACRFCNNAKHNQVHGGLLLKPDGEDPEPFFLLESATGMLVPNPTLDLHQRERAAATIRLCNLNRGGLREVRLEERDFVVRLIARLAHLEPESLQDLEDCLKPGRAYKFVFRYTMELHGQQALAQADRDRFHT